MSQDSRMEEKLTEELLLLVPQGSSKEISRLVSLIIGVMHDGSEKSLVNTSTNADVIALIRQLTGKTLQVADRVIDFSHSQLGGNINIGSVTRGNSITVNIYPQSASVDKQTNQPEDNEDPSFIWFGDMGVIQDGEEFILEQSKYYEKKFSMMLNVINSAIKPLEKLFFSFSVPRDLCLYQEVPKTIFTYAGSSNNWKISVNTKEVTATFKSNNDYVLYPSEQVHFCTVDIIVVPGIEYPVRSLIKCRYLHEYSSILNKEVVVRVEPEDFSRKRYYF